MKETIIPINIEEEVKQSYLNYAMSVIVSRALPDARDGLKPVHRRILYTMFELGMRYNTPTRKSAHVVGQALASFHPHGQTSVYDALVRMAQDFSLRYPLVVGQGNFGSLDRDPAAADRYTETKLEQISEEILSDIKKNTVDFVPNYDSSRTEPSVLPSALPTLLINGATGIAVGLTTEIPPHNLTEIANAIVHQIDNPDVACEDLLEYVKGPEFPTGAVIRGVRGIRDAYLTGAGRIIVQAHFTIEELNSGDRIIFSDIPYAKNKSEMIKTLADKVNNGIIDTIKDISDESNSDGVRVVIDLKRDANTQITLEKIFKHTEFRTSYSMRFTALVKGRPQQLSLKRAIQIYIDHRKEVITRKTQFELKEAESRAHILRGLLIALNAIDAVVKLIRASKNAQEASAALQTNFSLDEIQARAILDMRLQRLTSLEFNKLEDELAELEKLIKNLRELLASPEKIRAVIKETILRIKEKYGDARKTEILTQEINKTNEEDLIEKKQMLVTLSDTGYIKRTPLTTFGVQRRGGKGKFGLSLSKDDVPRHLFVGNTLDAVLFLTSRGRSFILKIYEIPQGSRTARGSSIKGILPLESKEYISSIVVVPKDDSPTETTDLYLFLATKKGKVKKVEWSKLSKSATTRRGVRALTLGEDDEVISGDIIDIKKDLYLFSKQGRVLRFPFSSVRSMGRTAAGVFGMKIDTASDSIVGALAALKNTEFLLISSQGFGKRLATTEITPHGRNTRGIRAMTINNTSGPLVAAFAIKEDDTISAITQHGKILRFEAKTCPSMGRNARGVTAIRVDDDDCVISVAVVKTNPDEQSNDKNNDESDESG